MENFSLVKNGYSPQEVDEHIEALRQIIKSYKNKDNAIKNSIINAQINADSIMHDARVDISNYKTNTLEQLQYIYDSVENQRDILQSFQDDYNEMVRRYFPDFEYCDLNHIYKRLEDLENYLQDLNDSVEEERKST